MKVLWCYLEFFLRNKHLAVTQEPLSTSESTVHYHIQYADKGQCITSWTRRIQPKYLSSVSYCTFQLQSPYLHLSHSCFNFLTEIYMYIFGKNACFVSNPSHSPYMGKQHKICTLSFQNFSLPPFTSSILDPNILLNSWFANIISLISSYWIRGVKV